MCVICSDNNLRLIINVDPTHTLTTRRRFVADIDKRFRALKKAVIEHIEIGALLKKDNPFGGFTINVTSAEWRSRYDPNRIPEFLEWLEEQNNKFILSKSGAGIQVFPNQTTPLFPGQASFDAKTQTTTRVLGGVEGRWTDVHIRSAYQKGVQTARINLRRQGIDIPGFESTAEGLSGVFNAPFHVDRVQLAFTQTYAGLQGVTKAMEAPIARALAQGMAEGRNPKALAREIAGIKGVIDKAGLNRARTLARTEVIRAHHGANIAEFRAIGIEGVKIKAEWLTAGDNRVCPRCDALEGVIFTLDEVEPMIPLHPNCRCVAIPIVPRGKSGRVVKSPPPPELDDPTVWKSQKNFKLAKKQLKDKFKINNIIFKDEFSSVRRINVVNQIGSHLARVTEKNPHLAKAIKRTKPVAKINMFENTNSISAAFNRSVGGNYNKQTRIISMSTEKFVSPIKDFLAGGYHIAEDSYATLVHEWGHHLHRQAPERIKSGWTNLWKKRQTGSIDIHSKMIEDISGYASTSEGEFFAESFNAHKMLNYGTATSDRLPVDVETFMLKHF